MITYTHTSVLTDCDYSPDGSYFVLGIENGEVLFYDTINRNNNLLYIRNRGSGEKTYGVKFSPLSDYLLVADEITGYIYRYQKFDPLTFNQDCI